jgi:uncharacterized phage protein (TIGR02220 family)
MSASVTVIDPSDSKYDTLAMYLGCNRFEAIGRMTVLWSWCTDRQLYVLTERYIRIYLGPDGVEGLVEAGFGEVVEGGVRIKGTEGRIEWAVARRERKQAAGRARAASAGRSAGRFVSDNTIAPADHQQTTSRPPATEPADDQLPPAFDTNTNTREERENAREGQPALELELTNPPESSASPRLALEAKAKAIALAAITELNRLTSSRYEPDGKAVLDDARKIASNGFTPEDATRVVEAKVREWASDERMAKQLKPSVLLRPSNFARYVGDVRGGNGVQARASPTTRDPLRQIRNIPLL